MEDGFYNGIICGVRVVDNRFGQPGKEVEFKVGIYDANNNPAATCEIYLEYSNRYGQGNMSQMKQWQICEADMKKLGYQYGSDFSHLDTLVNVKCRVNVASKDKNGVAYKGGTRYYFAFRTETKAVEGDVNSIMAQIRNGNDGGAAPAPAPAPAPAASGFGAPAPAPAPAAAPAGAFNFGGGAAPAPAPAPAAAPAAAGFPGFPA